MRSRWFILVTLLTLANFCVLAQVPKPRVDRIFVNGKIWTGDDARAASRSPGREWRQDRSRGCERGN